MCFICTMQVPDAWPWMNGEAASREQYLINQMEHVFKADAKAQDEVECATEAAYQACSVVEKALEDGAAASQAAAQPGAPAGAMDGIQESMRERAQAWHGVRDAIQSWLAFVDKHRHAANLVVQETRVYIQELLNRAGHT